MLQATAPPPSYKETPPPPPHPAPPKEVNSQTQVGELSWKRGSSQAHKVMKGIGRGRGAGEDGAYTRRTRHWRRGHRLPQGSAPHPPPPPKSGTNIYLTCHTRWAGNSNSLTHDTQPRRRQPRCRAHLLVDDGTPRPRRAVANLGIGSLSATNAPAFGPQRDAIA